MNNDREIDGKFPLTAEEIYHLDNITADSMSVDSALKIAMNYAMNRRAEIFKEERKWWQNVMDKYNLSDRVEWKIDRREAMVVVVEQEK